MAHALLSASGSSRWLACPPSARLEEKEPEKTSEYASEGTLAHEIGELMVRFNNDEFRKATYTRRLNKLKKHELFANDMLDYCETYAEIVREKYLKAKNQTPDAQLLVEQHLDFSSYVPKGFGTGDTLIIADNTIEVIDFKYGKGVPVSAKNNSQMKLYGLGALNEFNILYDIQNLKLTIVQPRIENLSEFNITVDDIYSWSENVVKPIAEIAYKGEGEFKAGDHCRFCKVKAKCKAYADEQLKLAKYDFKKGPFLSESDISDIILRVSDFTKWLKAVEKYALDQAVNHGQAYPELKLVEGRSNRTFKDKNKAKEALIAYGFAEDEILKPQELKGITDLSKIMGKKSFYHCLEEPGHIFKPQGKPTLVSINDKRPAWHSEDEARNDFKEIL